MSNPWKIIDWSIPDMVIAHELNVTKQAVNKARKIYSDIDCGEVKLIKIIKQKSLKQQRFEAYEMIDNGIKILYRLEAKRVQKVTGLARILEAETE